MTDWKKHWPYKQCIDSHQSIENWIFKTGYWSLFKKNEFIEIFVNTPILVCKNRDTKGLYKKFAKEKKLNNIGLSSAYQAPKQPDYMVSTEKESSVQIALGIFNKYFL